MSKFRTMSIMSTVWQGLGAGIGFKAGPARYNGPIAILFNHIATEDLLSPVLSRKCGKSEKSAIRRRTIKMHELLAGL